MSYKEILLFWSFLEKWKDQPMAKQSQAWDNQPTPLQSETTAWIFRLTQPKDHEIEVISLHIFS